MDIELILNQDGSLYHLNLLPEDIADTIIFVGDQDRVPKVSSHFDEVTLMKGKREFITHTGTLRGRRISVVSTGIGTDNIDIVLNEIDALFNVDLKTLTLKPKLRSVDIIRIGTSGTIQKDISMDQVMVSKFAIGFDALMQFYMKKYSEEELRLKKIIDQEFCALGTNVYVGRASDDLISKYAFDLPKGITLTAPGFYAPQGRQMRAEIRMPDLVQKASELDLAGQNITNLEMETAGIYALSNVLGHRCLSINAIVASRLDQRFSLNPDLVIEEAIKTVLSRF